ncbi:hypothetical protein F5878DRAFT_703383 [Lentinula raphanica]|uniref:Uncharacterized protein n=1 Tax=Lentinula raphanica TaxID=153919 RepID=A0AA38NXP2_9AGAR|nr:hypothetical protein F5878DRAFT_703383 [Lentinula raphanica]
MSGARRRQQLQQSGIGRNGIGRIKCEDTKGRFFKRAQGTGSEGKNGHQTVPFSCLYILGSAATETTVGPISLTETDHAIEAEAPTVALQPSGAASRSANEESAHQPGHVVHYSDIQTGSNAHYTVGQNGPFWPLTMISNPVGPLNIVFSSDGTPCPEMTWLIIAMLETQGVDIAIVRDEPDVMGGAMYDNKGQINFHLLKEGKLVAKATFLMHISLLRLSVWHARRHRLTRNPKILQLEYHPEHQSVKIRTYIREVLEEKIADVSTAVAAV